MNKKFEREQEILINMQHLIDLLKEDLNDDNYTHDYDNFVCNLDDMFNEFKRYYKANGKGGVYRELRRIE